MSSVTAVDLVNRGFGKIDARTIQAFTDGTTDADLATQYYESTLEELLAEHPWRFATTRVQLSQATALDGWDYAFTLPSDLVRIVELADNENFNGSATFRHHREGRLILTYASTCWLRYVKRFTTVAQMPALFQEALAQRFASYVARHLNRSQSLADALYEQSERTLAKAKSAEAQEEPHEEHPEPSWVTARYGAAMTND